MNERERACRDCGARVIWVDRSDGTSRFPADLVDVRAEQLWVIGVQWKAVQPTPMIVRRHRCSPEARAQFATELADRTIQAADTLERMEAQRAELARVNQLREEERTQQWKLAIRRHCPKCPARRGQPCLNLTELAKGNELPTRWPHYERLPEAYRTEKESR